MHLPGEAPRRQEASAAARSCRRQLSYPQLAIKNDVHYNTIHGWAERYGEEIAVIRDDMDARATVGWAAEKANRIAEYQHDLDVINEYLDGPDLNHQARIRYIDKKTKILHAIAEEMSELPTRIKIPLPSQSPSPRSS